MVCVFATLCVFSIIIMVTGMVWHDRLVGGATPFNEQVDMNRSSTKVGLEKTNLHLEASGEKIMQRSVGKSFSAEMDAVVMWEGVKQGNPRAVSFFMIVIGGTGIALFFLLTIMFILF